MDGNAPEKAYLTLKDAREATFKGVGEWRIKLAEELLLPQLLA